METLRLYIKNSLQTVAEVAGYGLLLLLLVNGALELYSRWQLADSLIALPYTLEESVSSKSRR